MYEQQEVPVLRRILWIVLWFVVALAIIWVLVWFLFFRHHASKPIAPHKPQDQSIQPHNQSTAPTKKTPAPTTSAPSAPNASTTPAASPSQLANTGAGNVLVPFAVASVGGTAFYYIRTRRKLV